MFKVLTILLLLLNICHIYAQDQSFLKQKANHNFKKFSGKISSIELLDFDEKMGEDGFLSSKPKLLTRLKDDILNTDGYVDLGYSYGLNTIFTDTTRGINSIFSTSGALRTSIFNLPFQVSYNYSTLRVPLGANNYFRVSFDKERYIENQKSKLNERLGNISEISDKLNKKKALIANMQGKSEVYLNMLQRKMEIEAKKIAEEQKKRVNDSIQKIENQAKEDIDKTKNDAKDGFNEKMESGLNSNKASNKREDIVKAVDKGENTIKKGQDKYEELQKEYERVQKTYQKLLSTRQKCDSLIDKYKEYENKLLQYQEKLKDPDFSEYEGALKNKMGFINSIQKIDIGLTYPNTTGLSDQNVAVKGIGTEFQYKNFYFALTVGTTLDNMMLSTNEITNQLQNNQNVFNHFDFQHVKDNGVLTSVKTGWGSPKETHAFVGFNYLTNTKFLNKADDISTSYDPAASIELDLRYVPDFYKGGTLDLIYGRTSANHQKDTVEREVFNTLFSNYPSNAFMTKYTQYISSIRSHFSIQYRSIDPLTNTTVYGVMQPGNKRVSFESRHKVNSFLKVGTTYKYDKSYGSPTRFTLHTKGVNVSGAYKNYLNYSAMINHVNFITVSPLGETKKGTSYISGVNLQSNYKIKEFKAITNLSYNDYLFVDTINVAKFSQLGISEAIKGKNWIFNLSYNYFFQRIEVAEKNNVFGIGLKWMRDKVSLDGGLKVNVSKETSMGGHLEVNWKMMKYIEITVRGERFVKGNFFQNYFNERYNSFPYLFTINTRFKF